MSARPSNKRAPSFAKALALEKIIGTTSRHNSSLSTSPTTGEIAYAAGCAVVFYNPKDPTNQYRFFVGAKPKSVSCLAFSPNGKYLAVGESGHQPAVLILEVATLKLISELPGHRFGIACVKFDPTCKWLVSVGFQQDKLINLWDWREKQVLALNKVANKIYSIDFPEDGSFFVTSGTHHLKIWNHVDDKGLLKKSEKTHKGRFILDGKMVSLGEQHKDSTFMDICCSKTKNLIYAVTSDSFLIQIDSSTKRIEKWVNMRAKAGNGLSVSEKYISVGCDNGTSRLFTPGNLQYIATLPMPPALGHESGNPPAHLATQTKVYPDVIGVKFVLNDKLFCLYSNRTIIIWDTKETSKFGIYRSFLSHGACIWDLAVASNGSFITASADHTIRTWNPKEVNPKIIFSKEMSQCFPIVDDVTQLNLSQPNSEPIAGNESLLLGDEGIRCLALSPDEKHLASGDRVGNIRVYSLEQGTCISTHQAHEGEVLALAYSTPLNGERLLASGSRDRLIHIFKRTEKEDAEPYVLATTLDDHSSTITSIAFSEDRGSTKLVSSSADKSILFRNVNLSQEPIALPVYHRESLQFPLYDMTIEPKETSIIGVGTEPKLTSWEVNAGKKSKSTPISDPDTTKSCKHLKIDLDPSGQYAVTSSQDRFIRLYDITTGSMITRVCGHSELTTGVKFTRDGTGLISIGADGCIFIWKLSSDLSMSIKKKYAQISNNVPRAQAFLHWNSKNCTPSSSNRTMTHESAPSSCLDPLSLPLWAQKLYFSQNPSHKATPHQKPFSRRHQGQWRTEINAHFILLENAGMGRNLKKQSEYPQTPKFEEESLYLPNSDDESKNANLTSEFTIDNSGAKLPTEELLDEEIADNTLMDESFVSFSEETLTDSLLFPDFEDPKFSQPKKPSNLNRLSLSAKFQNEKSENFGISTKYSKPSTIRTADTPDDISEKRAKFDREVERSRQILKEKGIYVGPSPTKPKDPQPTQPTDTPPQFATPPARKPPNFDLAQDVNLDSPSPHSPTQEQGIDSDPEMDSTKPPDCEAFLENLKSLFDASLELYWQLSSHGDDSIPLERFQDTFCYMKSRLDEIVPNEEEERQNQMLEKYSEMLVGLVKSKLEPK